MSRSKPSSRSILGAIAALCLCTSCSLFFGSADRQNPVTSATPTTPVNTPTIEVRLGDRHIFSEGGFSFQPPANWEKQEISGLQYATFVAKSTNDAYAPNISFIDDTFTGSLEEYANRNINSISKAFDDFKKIERSPFITDSGTNGIVFIGESNQLGESIRQTFYIFEGAANKKLIVTCSSLAKDSEILAPLFAASMKTIKIE